MNKLKSVLCILLIEVFIFTQCGGVCINSFSVTREDVTARMIRRGRVGSTTTNPTDTIDRADSLTTEAVGAKSTERKTEYILNATKYYKEAFKKQPFNPQLVEKLKGWLDNPETATEKQVVAAMVLVNLMDSQLSAVDGELPDGFNVEEGVKIDSEEINLRLECLKKIKENQHLVAKPSNYEERIDMHVHTFRSDGMKSPAAIVLQAWQEGMKSVGVVDHNGFSHIYEAVKAGEILGVEVTPGVEFDVVDKERNIKNMHTVAYFDKGGVEDYKEWLTNLQNTSVYKELKKLKQAYINKTVNKMVENFNNREFTAKDASGEELVLSKKDLIGYLTDTPNKYQLGMALLAKYGEEKLGVDHYKEVVKKYFSDKEEWKWQEESLNEVGEKSTYIKVSPDGLSLDKIMKFAASQGGAVILPHPGEFLEAEGQTFKDASRSEKLDIYRELLKDYDTVTVDGKEYLGIRGIELYSAKNSSEDREDMIEIMEEMNEDKDLVYNKFPLIATTGSDAHSQTGQETKLVVGENNIPWIATTYLFQEKLDYQMGLTESAANAEDIVSAYNLEIPKSLSRYETGEYLYWAKRILDNNENIDKKVVEKSLPVLLQRDKNFRHLTAESKAAVIEGLSAILTKTDKSIGEVIEKTLNLAQQNDKDPYSYLVTPGGRLTLADGIGIDKGKMKKDRIRDWFRRNGDKLFMAGTLGGTAALMALFANVIGWEYISEMGMVDKGLFGLLELGASPFFFKVSEFVNKFIAGKLSPQVTLPEEDLATYGFNIMDQTKEISVMPEKGFSIMSYSCGSPREKVVERTLKANPGVPIMIFSYKTGDSYKKNVLEKVKQWNEKYGEGYPGGKAVLAMSQANSWWEGPSPGPKHGNLADLYEWLSDMDSGYESTNSEYQDELTDIRNSRKTFASLPQSQLEDIEGDPEVTFFNENFNSTDIPPTLQKVKQLVGEGNSSKEQLKNMVRAIYKGINEKFAKGKAPQIDQLPIWYTNVRGKLMFNPEYIKKDFKWVAKPNGNGRIIAETWAVWEDPKTGEKTYVRERKVVFDDIVGDKETYKRVINTIPLDGDSVVPRDPETGEGYGIRLIQKAMASINRPILDKDNMSIKEGYGLIQPLQLIGNVEDTQWTELMARERERMIFDQEGQMNLLYSGVDYGKNLKVIRGKNGEGIAGPILKYNGRGVRGGVRNSIKPSPDIIEGSYLKPAFALDLFFLENEQPKNYIVDSLRSGKWGTGDVLNVIQDFPLLPVSVNNQGLWSKSKISGIDRFRILSNAIGIGTNASYPFWMGLWAVSAYLGKMSSAGVISPEMGVTMFGLTAGTYIALSKVIPKGKRFSVGDFTKTQALMANVAKIPPVVAKGLWKFVRGEDMSAAFGSTRKYQQRFNEISLKDIYLLDENKNLGFLATPLLASMAITGTALATKNMAWLTWGSVLSASLATSGLITYITGEDRGDYIDAADKVESNIQSGEIKDESLASGYKKLGQVWSNIAEDHMTTKISRLSDVLETYTAFKEMVDKGKVSLSSVARHSKLVKNPTLYAKVMKDFLFSAVDSNGPKMEHLKNAIWDNLTSYEKNAFADITGGNRNKAKNLFFDYVNAVYDEMLFNDEVGKLISDVGIRGAVSRGISRLESNLKESEVKNADMKAQERIYELIKSINENVENRINMVTNLLESKEITVEEEMREKIKEDVYELVILLGSKNLDITNDKILDVVDNAIDVLKGKDIERRVEDLEEIFENNEIEKARARAWENVYEHLITTVKENPEMEKDEVSDIVIQSIEVMEDAVSNGKIKDMEQIIDKTVLKEETSSGYPAPAEQLYKLIAYLVRENISADISQVLNDVNKTLSAMTMWIAFRDWAANNEDATPYEKLKKLNSLLKNYDIIGG